MNAIRLSITAILAALSSTPSLAQSSDPTPILAVTSYARGQPITAEANENPTAKNPLSGEVAVDRTFGYGATAKALWNAARVRTNALNMEIARSDMVVSNDQASFAIYAPMQAVNVALSFAGYVSQSRLDDSSITWVQVLSLAAKQQINAELKYSVKMNGFSKFDSFITYRANHHHDLNKVGMAAGLRYNIKF